jgi:acyl-CoA hydrolase
VEALIQVADPKFRGELEDFARRSKLLVGPVPDLPLAVH